MGEDRAGLREPETTWDYAMSAADVLTIWRARDVPAVGRDPLRTDIVVLIGSALYARARSTLAEGAPAVMGASLAYLHSLLGDTAWLADCPPPPGMGREEMARMVLDFERMAVARYAARDVLAAHLDAAAAPAVTVAERAAGLGLGRGDEAGTGLD